MTTSATILREKVHLVDDKDWIFFDTSEKIADRAEEIASRYTDTTQARTFLARSIIALNKEGLSRNAGGVYGWVPDRKVGEMVVFGFPGSVTFRSAEQATPEAYAAQNRSRFAAATNLKVLDCSTGTRQCPAGPMVLVSSVQRQRRTTTLFMVAQAVVFPQVDGLNEGVTITLFNLNPDDLKLAADTGRFACMMANSLAVEIGRPDGSTFTVGPWGVGA